MNENIDAFLKSFFLNSQFKILPLAGDASARKYYRVNHENENFVLMSWQPFDPETYPFLDVLKHFDQADVHVPKVHKVDGLNGLILLEDLGDLTLERKFWESQAEEKSWPFYKNSLDEIIKIHVKATALDQPTLAKTIMFDTAKFLWELNYAREHLIEGVLKYKLSLEESNQLQELFTDISQKLHHEPKVICHRDYHSRNLMIKFDKVYVIDFQDARLGPVQYDLVSLIKDSYVNISDTYAERMITYYLDQTNYLSKMKITREHFNRIYELQSLQRCFKACGSFASFLNTRDDRRYLKYLPPTLKRVSKALELFPEYDLLADLLNRSKAYQTNYEQL